MLYQGYWSSPSPPPPGILKDLLYPLTQLTLSTEEFTLSTLFILNSKVSLALP